MDDVPSIALGQPGKRELGKCPHTWFGFWFVCAASSSAAAEASLQRPGFGKSQVGPMLGWGSLLGLIPPPAVMSKSRLPELS